MESMGAHKLNDPAFTSFRGFHRAPLIVLILLLTPVLFLNTGDYHDWGDDFAQYMLQGYHLLGMKTEVNVQCLEWYGPAVKSPLFSILLCPILVAGGKVYLNSKILVGLSLIICGLLLYSITARELNSHMAGMLAALFLVYNSVILVHKDQILPDTLFMAFLLAGISCFLRGSSKGVVICTAGLVLLKPVGFIFLALTALLYLSNDQKTIRNKVILIISLSVIAIVAVMISGFWPHRPAGDLSVTWYLQTVVSSGIPEGFLPRALKYITTIQYFIDNDVHWLPDRIGKILFWFFFLAGAVNAWSSRSRVTIFFILTYVLVILIYPYDDDPLRLLVLIFPLILLMVLMGIKFICQFIGVRSALISVPFLVIMTLMNIPNAIVSISGERNSAGPFNEGFMEVKQFVESNVPEDGLIRTDKPWAVALMTNRSAMPSLNEQQDIHSECNPGWDLEFHGSAGKEAEPSENSLLLFSNISFSLYKVADI